MDPVTLLVGTAASCGVTELIKVVIQWTQAAAKCKSECKKLHDELVFIAPDVGTIERRLAKLRKANRAGDAHDDLQMVENWLQQLKSAIEGAQLDVHRCNSGRFSIDQHKLSARLTAQFGTITRLGHQRQALFLLLRNLMHAPAHAEQHQQKQQQQQHQQQQQQHQQQHHQHQQQQQQHHQHQQQQQHHQHQQHQQHHQQQQQQRAENWFDNPGESVSRKMADEHNDALRCEGLTRLSMSSSSSSSSSGHGGWSFDYAAFDASGYGTDSPRANLLRQGTEARDVTVFQQQHDKPQVSRRHTVAAGTQATIAKAFGHDPLPAPDKWKY